MKSLALVSKPTSTRRCPKTSRKICGFLSMTFFCCRAPDTSRKVCGFFLRTPETTRKICHHKVDKVQYILDNCALKNNEKFTNHYFEKLCPWSLALASSICVLGLESACPRKLGPWPRILFEFLAYNVGPSTSPLIIDTL